MVNYPIGDFLIRIKNAAYAGKSHVECDKTNLIETVSEALKRESYLDSVELSDGKIVARLKFHKKKPIIQDIKLISKPGLRIYQGVSEIKSKKGVSTYLISTQKGIMSSKEAIKANLGGEIIAEIW